LDNNDACKNKALRAIFCIGSIGTASSYLLSGIHCRSVVREACERLVCFRKAWWLQVVIVFKETGSGTKLDRTERKNVLALAQAREIDGVLEIGLSRWGLSTIDLLRTLHEPESWKISVIAEFEHDLIGRRVISGLAAAKARGRKLGRQPGQPPGSDKLASQVFALIDEGQSYRWIATDLGICKNTVNNVIKRAREAA